MAKVVENKGGGGRKVKKIKKAEESGNERKVESRKVKKDKAKREEGRKERKVEREREESGKERKVEKVEREREESGKERKVEKVEREREEEKEVEKPRDVEKKEKVIEKIKFHAKRILDRKVFSLIYRKKKRKPKFLRQEFGKLKRLKEKWRRPRGIDSKKRVGKRGKGKLPKIGYKKPENLRHLHPSGYRPILIHNVKELENLDPKKEAIVIASAVGRRKRNDIIRIANEKKIAILNPKLSER